MERQTRFILLLVSLSSLGAAPPSSRMIVALGDSTTAGTPFFRSPAEAPPAGRGNPEGQFGYWIMQARPGWNILNRGVAGQRTDEISRRFEADVLAHAPEALILMAGINDLFQGMTPEEIERGLGDLYDKAQALKVPVVACTILPYDEASSRVRERMREVNAWIREESRRRGFFFCDTYAAAEDPNRPGFLHGSPDGLHPDVPTTRRVGEAVTAALDEALR